MKFTSTTSSGAPVSLAEAINRCVATDGGMFMPAWIPTIPKAFFNNIGELSLREIAYVVITSFLGEDITPAKLKKIVDDAFAFDIPLVGIGKDNYVLELFHGPTLTFKDFGARFMARLLHDAGGKRHVLVATTGNTGAAAANGLYRLDGVSVSVLYPQGKLTKAQTSQITALGENVHAVEVRGSIEDCKRLVCEAMADESLRHLNLTGANSINIARLLPQIAFSFHAYARLLEMGVDNASNALYSIPCGNLSNLVATAIACSMGLPMGGMIAAVNANDQIRNHLLSGSDNTDVQPIHTFAPSIDMSIPTGWPRLKYLYKGDVNAMKRDIIFAEPVDNDTIARMVNNLSANGYLIDPHGAIAYEAARRTDSNYPKVIFATGHPAKQLNVMTAITGKALEYPVQLNRFMSVSRHAQVIAPTLPALKKHLNSIQ